MHFQFGDLATWLGSVGVVGTLVAALFQIRTERNQRLKIEEQERRRVRQQQAERISGWAQPDDPERHVTPLVLLNRSDEPVYEVVVTLVMIQGGGARRGEQEVAPGYRRTVNVLPPGRWRIEVSGGWQGMNRRPGVEVAFIDRSGVSWIRRGTGTIEEIPKAPIDHYALGRPQELCFPIADEAHP